MGRLCDSAGVGGLVGVFFYKYAIPLGLWLSHLKTKALMHINKTEIGYEVNKKRFSAAKRLIKAIRSYSFIKKSTCMDR
jgi:hypothetical protein